MQSVINNVLTISDYDFGDYNELYDLLWKIDHLDFDIVVLKIVDTSLNREVVDALPWYNIYEVKTLFHYLNPHKIFYGFGDDLSKYYCYIRGNHS